MSESAPPTRRRWFRFSLRSLFVIVTVVAVFIAYQVNWIRQRRQIIGRCIAATRSWDDVSPPIRAPQLLWLFGEPGYADIFVGFESDYPRMLNSEEMEELERIRGLFPEAQRILGLPSAGMPPAPQP